MNIISACLQIDASGARITDPYGAAAEVNLPLGAAVRLDLDLRGAPDPETGVLQPCSGAVPELSSAVCYFALDRDFDRRTEPLLLRTEGITVSSGGSGSSTVFSVPIPNTGVEPLVSAMAEEPSAEFYAEIGAIDSAGDTVFSHQFAVAVRNRIYLGGDAPDSVAGDPAYWTAAETRAVISAAVPQQVGEAISSGGYATSAAVSEIVSSCGYATSAAVSEIVSSCGYATSTAVAEIAGSVAGLAIEPLAASSGTVTLPATEGKVYTHTLAAGETIVLAAASSGYMPTVELHLAMPSTAVSFSFGTTIWWSDTYGNFASGNAAPDFSTGGKVYALVFRFDGTRWLGNLVYTTEA